MGEALRRVESQQSTVLGADEQFVAAGQGHSLAESPAPGGLPARTIWAVTPRRLLVWAAEGRDGADCGSLVAELALGVAVRRVTLEPYKKREAKMTVYAGTHAAVVTMDLTDARSIAQVIGEVSSRIPPPPPTITYGTVPPTPVMPEDRSLGDMRIAAFLGAVEAGDWSAAEEQLSTVSSPAERECFISQLTGENSRTALDAWVAARPGLGDAFLLRGVSGVAWAWEVLGGSHPGNVEPQMLPTFYRRLRNAEQDLMRAVELCFDDPVPWTPLLKSGRGLHISIEELCLRYDESVKRSPALLGAHLHTLIGLGGAWSGSNDAMLAFARTTARAAPEGSSLHALVPMAHLICAADLDDERRHRYFTADIAKEVTFFSSLSVDRADWIDDATTVRALNIFAAALLLCRDRSRANEVMERIGSRRSDMPWNLFGDGDDLFHEAQSDG